MATNETCILKTCSRPRKTRGLCNACNASAKKAIAAGETTWGELEAEGMATPARPRGRRSPMAEAIAELRARRGALATAAATPTAGPAAPRTRPKDRKARSKRKERTAPAASTPGPVAGRPRGRPRMCRSCRERRAEVRRPDATDGPVELCLACHPQAVAPAPARAAAPAPDPEDSQDREDLEPLSPLQRFQAPPPDLGMSDPEPSEREAPWKTVVWCVSCGVRPPEHRRPGVRVGPRELCGPCAIAAPKAYSHAPR